MNMFQRFSHHAVPLIGALLLCAGHIAHADDLEDANKLFRQGQHGPALDKANAYLADKPKDAQARFLKGLILTEQGKTAEAIKIFSALTEDYPELPEPYNNLAVLYASQGQYDKAKLALEMAIRTHPSYATAHENLGDIYAKMASQAYDRALQLDRSNTATQTKLAMIQDIFAGNARKNEAPAPNGTAPVKPGGATPAVIAAGQPKPEKPAAATTADGDALNALLKTVDAWAAAWSAQNVAGYLSFYADDFKTKDGESRAAWEASRRERISNPKSIRVSVGKPSVKFADNEHATVKFRQSYRSGHLNTSSNKTLLMVKSGGKWLIREERSK